MPDDKTLDSVLTDRLMEAALKDAEDAAVKLNFAITYYAEQGHNPLVVAMAAGIVLGIRFREKMKHTVNLPGRN